MFVRFSCFNRIRANHTIEQCLKIKAGKRDVSDKTIAKFVEKLRNVQGDYDKTTTRPIKLIDDGMPGLLAKENDNTLSFHISLINHLIQVKKKARENASTNSRGEIPEKMLDVMDTKISELHEERRIYLDIYRKTGKPPNATGKVATRNIFTETGFKNPLVRIEKPIQQYPNDDSLSNLDLSMFEEQGAAPPPA